MSTKAKNFLRRMKQRLVIIFGIALLFFVVLIGRVIYISLAKGQEYQEEVLDQKTISIASGSFFTAVHLSV